MNDFEIVNASITDLEIIMNIYGISKQYMIDNNNPTQWNKNYPSLEIIKNDINNKNLYILKKGSIICAVFCFIIGNDDTYSYIEGKWLSNDLYGTIHRIGSNFKYKKVFENIFYFCKNKISHLRIDTHINNKVMQYLIEKYDFHNCGIIYVKDGSKRIAYEIL